MAAYCDRNKRKKYGITNILYSKDACIFFKTPNLIRKYIKTAHITNLFPYKNVFCSISSILKILLSENTVFNVHCCKCWGLKSSHVLLKVQKYFKQTKHFAKQYLHFYFILVIFRISDPDFSLLDLFHSMP